MSPDLCHLNIFLILAEFVFMFCAPAVILIDWFHGLFERSVLWSYLPQWRQSNLRHNVYLCLLGFGITIMYTNSVQDSPSKTVNDRLVKASIGILLSFWLQNKIRPENTSDQSASPPQDRLSRIHSLLLPITPEDKPQPEVNIEEELRSDYVKVYREIYDERKVPEEKLVAAIKYLNRLKGGIKAQRSPKKLMAAIDHLDIMRSLKRIDDSGLPLEYSPEELLLILDSTYRKYRFKDVLRVLKNHLKNNSFLPSPDEFVELYREMKGIVQLEEEVAEKTQALERTQRVVEETCQQMEETRQEVEEKNEALDRTQIVVEEKAQALEEIRQEMEKTRQKVEERTQKLVASRHKILSLKESLRQQQQALQQVREESVRKDRVIQCAIQRVRELEQNPEGVHQRRYSELEEEIRCLSAQSQRSLCKVCCIREVQVVFLPCTHMVTCEGCVSTLHRGKCPMCENNIQNKIRVLLA